jgi:chromosome transmission fidelity protein 8
MTTAYIYPPSRGTSASSPLPKLLQTPSGLALLELQGTINLPKSTDGESLGDVEVGRIEFPDYDPDAVGSAWMQRVHMYIGQHQRLTGEVKKLPKAIAVVRRRESGAGKGGSGGAEEEEGKAEDLEVVEIVKHKLMFSNRPEPVGTANAD